LDSTLRAFEKDSEASMRTAVPLDFFRLTVTLERLDALLRVEELCGLRADDAFPFFNLRS
jgi:hypothetical protein